MPSVEEYRARVAITVPESVRGLSVVQAPPSLVGSPQNRSSAGQYQSVAA
jgi:hypothetical protein